MYNKDFFNTVEEKLQVIISEKIKAHLKFHNMDSFKVASALTETDIVEIEDFARTTLYQILQPEEILQFYGTHFQKKPELFVFTLGERMHLSGIKQVCQEICDENQEETEKYDVQCDFSISSKKLADAPKQDDDSKNQMNVEKKPEKGENNSNSTNKKKIAHVPCEAVKQCKETSTMICIKNFNEDTTDEELKQLTESFGPIRWQFLSKNKDSGYCNGFGGVDFKCREDAVKAIEILNGCRYKERFLIVQWWSPKPRKRLPNANN